MDIQDIDDGIYALNFTSSKDDNYITSDGLLAFAAILDEILSKPRLLAVVLSGEGANFCSGRVGVKGLTAASDIRDDLNIILAVNKRLRASPVPFIAAVEGRAFGFGCGFATQCDITIAGRGARFALPEMSHKLPPLIVLSYFTRFVPYKNAFELALTSREFGAAEASGLGIVTEVVDDGAAFERAVAFARMVATLDADSVRLLRAFSRRVHGLSDDVEAQNGVATMALTMSARALAAK
jgi:enoyl-CoA hydratase/carnithine racemase